MNKNIIIGVSAFALSAALGMQSAFAITTAPRSVSGQIADYNAAEVKVAGDIVTVPAGYATYSISNVAGAGSLEINSRFTVTLPSGFSFSSQPALSSSGGTTFVLSTGGIGAQSVTFTVGTAPLVGGQTATLGSFAVQGVSALETPIPVAAALPITMQATNNSQINNDDAQPLSLPVFASDPGAHAVFVGAVQFIDLTSPVLGTEFGTNPATDSTTAVLSAIALSPTTVSGGTPVLSPDGLPNTLSTSDTATVTIPGLFNGISAAFSSTASNCATSISAGTVTPTSLTVPGVPFNQEVFFCVTSNGTALLQQQPPNGENPTTAYWFSPTVAPGTSTDFLDFNCPPGIGACNEYGGLWTYFGGGVISVTNFFTGDDAGYSSLLRVNNAGSTPTNLFALAQPDTGGPMLTGSLGSLGAGEGTVFTEGQVAAAVSGLSLANSGQRATLQLIISGDFQNVKASSLLVNPGGTVDNVGVPQTRPPA